MLRIFYFFLTLLLLLPVEQICGQNNILKGQVLFLNSGNKPAVGVHIKEQDTNNDYTKDNGEYFLEFQNKRSGASLKIEVGTKTRSGKKIELVNEKEVIAARLPDTPKDSLIIIVCLEGERDIAAEKYYNILRTTADFELDKKKKEIEILLKQKEKDYNVVSGLFAQLEQMKSNLDSTKLRQRSFSIASINLDQASQIVKDAVQKIEEDNDVENALKILDFNKLDTSYQIMSQIKRNANKIVLKADKKIGQIIEGYELKINLLEPQFKYRDIAKSYDRIAVIFEKENYDEKEMANTFINAATYWEHDGNYQKQLGSSLKALNIFEEIVPIDSNDISVSYSNVAWAYGNLGEYQKALEYGQKYLIIKKSGNVNDSLELAKAFNNLGWIYGKLGDYSKQLELHKKSLELRESNSAIDSSILAVSYNNIAETYGSLGDYEQQLNFNLKALNIWVASLPENHPDLGKPYSNLAGTYGNLGEPQKQLDFNLKALNIWEKSLHPYHPSLGVSYNNIAKSYQNLGNYEKQLEYNLKASRIFEKVLPIDHKYVAISYNNIANTHSNLGNLEKELEYNLKALHIFEKVLSKDHPTLAISYSNTALTYGSLGQFQEQLKYDLKAINIREMVLPPDHPDLASSYNNLGATYGNLEDYQKQLKFILKVLDIRERVLPINHPDLILSYNNVGRAYRDVKDYKKAISFGQNAVSLGENKMPKHPRLDIFYTNLAFSYLKQKESEKAKLALEKSQNIKITKDVYQGWAMYYALQKERKQAIENLQKAFTFDYTIKDIKWLETESSLKKIRTAEEYEKLIQRLKKIE